MRFRNVTDHAREIPTLGDLVVEPDELTPDLPDDVAAGFLHQEAVWHADGDEARAVQQQAIADEADRVAALAAGDGPPLPAPPSKRAPVADWVEWAVAVGVAAGVPEDVARAEATALTKPELMKLAEAALAALNVKES